MDIAKTEKEEQGPACRKGDIAAEDYDVIFLGYPNWWGDMPMAVYTFIEKHDWNGKTVIPFCTHEGSGLSGTGVFWNKPARARPLPKVSQFKELPPRTRRPRQKRPCSPG